MLKMQKKNFMKIC